MKTVFLLIIGLLLCGGALAQPTQDLGSGFNIRDMVQAQIYRYAREQFLKKNYAESQNAFERILKINCENRVAQYHLQKIASMGREYHSAEAFLNNLSCPKYDFQEEDFLPISVFYESDADLVLEQMLVYNQKYRIAKNILFNKIEEQTNQTTRLEGTLDEISASLESAQHKAAKGEEWKKELVTSQTASLKLEQELQGLRESLRASQDSYKKSMITKTCDFTTQGTTEKPCPTSALLAKTHIQSLAVTSDPDAKRLHQKFENLQQRLTHIETSLQDKNAKIQTLQTLISNR